MALAIETFSNQTGGSAFFKAAGHPAVVPAAKALLARLENAGPVAVYDPFGHLATFDALHPLAGATVAGYYVQKVEHLSKRWRGHAARPVTEIGASGAKLVFLAAFDAARASAHIRHLVPAGAEIVTLDAMKLPPALVTVPGRYLDPLNFATNFAFFRDAGGLHTRVVTANYWSGYGPRRQSLWLNLFDAEGKTLATWTQELAEGAAAIVLDSREIRARFGLGEFAGQLFIHALGAQGHDVVKYALDVYGDTPEVMTCTHDANAWPSDLFAGLPAPRAGERVVLWVQNSHPCPIPPGGVGLNGMGREDVAWLDREIPGFASHPVDVATLLPDLRYPGQIEIQAGRHMVRPRYEIVAPNKRLRIAHPNVERTDLKLDPAIRQLGNLMGRGHMLPAPLLPVARYKTALLPTPMSTAQTELPVALSIHDADGREMARHRFGRLARKDSVWLEIDDVLKSAAPKSGYGNMFLHYDFAQGGDGDGWLHAIVRVEDRRSGHAAETSFGSHIFNTAITFGNEPQSYAGPAPGLSTRLFLRLGVPPHDSFCHLIYPVSAAWHATSTTDLILTSASGHEIARHRLAIPANGSRLWRASEIFGWEALNRAGPGGYVLIRDMTCRLFGYHGLVNGETAFSLDHMFGF